MKKKVVAPGALASKATIVGDLVFVGGITARPGDAETQIKKTFEILAETLKECGTSMENVLTVQVFLIDLADREPYLNPVWKEHFPENPPARATVKVELTAKTFIEITAVACIPDK